MDRPPLRLLLIGVPAAGRFDSVQNVLVKSGADVQLEAIESIAELRSSRAAIEAPDLILVFQDWPEQYTSAEAGWLLSSHTTSRVLCVYGGWCESDGRTRNVWVHAVRVPQWRFPFRLRREVQILSGADVPLPLTASRRECFLFEHRPKPVSTVIPDRVIRIVTRDRAFAGALTAVLDLPEPPLTAPDVILFDVDPWNMETEQELEGLAGDYPQARLIGLTGFPSHAPVGEITAAGASAVLPKLLTAEELVDALC